MAAILLLKPSPYITQHREFHRRAGEGDGTWCSGARARNTAEPQKRNPKNRHPVQTKTKNGWLENGNGGVRHHCIGVKLHRSE